MKTNITPGPWRVVREEEVGFPDSVRSKAFGKSAQMGDYRGVIVAGFKEAHGSRDHAIKESEANAKAIAAVPEMIEALIKAYGLWWNEVYELAYGENMGDPEHAREVADSDPHVKQFKAALEKAGVEV